MWLSKVKGPTLTFLVFEKSWKNVEKVQSGTFWVIDVLIYYDTFSTSLPNFKPRLYRELGELTLWSSAVTSGKILFKIIFGDCVAKLWMKTWKKNFEWKHEKNFKMCLSQNFVFCTPELWEAVTCVKINEMGSGWSLSIRESPLYKMAIITPFCQSGTFYLGQPHMFF